MSHRTQPLNRPLRLSDPAAPWWLPGGHAQTIWPALFSPAPTLALRRERWEWNDGDFVDADWVQPEPRETWAPVLVIFHGLEGSSKSHYARAIARAATDAGLRVVIVHFRGCSGEPNRLARAYHSGDADEIERV
ncbi:MAG TPA: alpha/beta hydrolase, partial [Burkholderiaceae bacterium]|nr:alpha/beta hydrolase [Burkholderiaceae bacterium]